MSEEPKLGSSGVAAKPGNSDVASTLEGNEVVRKVESPKSELETGQALSALPGDLLGPAWAIVEQLQALEKNVDSLATTLTLSRDSTDVASRVELSYQDLRKKDPEKLLNALEQKISQINKLSLIQASTPQARNIVAVNSLLKLQSGAEEKLNILETALQGKSEESYNLIRTIAMGLAAAGVILMVWAYRNYGTSGNSAEVGVMGLVTVFSSIASGILASSVNSARKATVDRIQSIMLCRSWVMCMNLHLFAMRSANPLGEFDDDCRKTVAATASAIANMTLAHVDAIEKTLDDSIPAIGATGPAAGGTGPGPSAGGNGQGPPGGGTGQGPSGRPPTEAAGEDAAVRNAGQEAISGNLKYSGESVITGSSATLVFDVDPPLEKEAVISVSILPSTDPDGRRLVFDDKVAIGNKATIVLTGLTMNTKYIGNAALARSDTDKSTCDLAFTTKETGG